MSSTRKVATDATVLIRLDHDPERPSLDSGAAARLLDVSRQTIIDWIRRGTLAGYCLQGPERLRWFAYADSVNLHRGGPAEQLDQAAELRDRLAALENELAALKDSDELRRQSEDSFQKAVKHMANANLALIAAYKARSEAEAVVSSRHDLDWVPTHPPGGGS